MGHLYPLRTWLRSHALVHRLSVGMCLLQVEYLKYSNMEQSTAARISGQEGSAELAKRYGIKTEILAFKLYHADNKHE